MAGSLLPASQALASHGLAAVVVGILAILALALIRALIHRNRQSKDAFARQLKAQTLKLAREVEESQRLFARLISSGIALEEMNEDLQRSLESAQTARRQLAEEHEAFTKLQDIAQREAARARWLEGVTEATTALAHEVNNPLTALLMNLEFLEEGGPDQASEIAEIQAAAQRIADVVKRLTSVANPQSVPYVGGGRMLDLSRKEPE